MSEAGPDASVAAIAVAVALSAETTAATNKNDMSTKMTNTMPAKDEAADASKAGAEASPSAGQKRPRDAGSGTAACDTAAVDAPLSSAADGINESAAASASESAVPITVDGEMPQKKFYRSRAHCNPLSHNDAFDYPAHPSLMDWTKDHYPDRPALLVEESAKKKTIAPDVLDIGCGFGGLTVALSTLLPSNTILGMEIRAKVTEYVRLRILACRRDHASEYRNASVLRTNSMRYLPNYFRRGSIEKIFICFPDPHFKKRNHPRRIVSERLLTEYAHFLMPGGRLYAITDVKELHQWHLDKCSAHPLFRELTAEEIGDDPCVDAMRVETEEGKKVEREGRDKYHAVWERLDDADERVPRVSAENFWEAGQFGVVTASARSEGGDGNGNGNRNRNNNRNEDGHEQDKAEEED